jgi:uncharacterized YigZ family protein
VYDSCLSIDYHSSMPPGPEDRIRTVAASATASILVLGSKFLAFLAPATSEYDAEGALHQRSRRYPDASHHCWAQRLGRPGVLIERSSDAGEPTGTAGSPILDALKGASLENVVCVVSRYFGGTKLGTGGLVRAYADAATAVIAEAQVRIQTVVREIDLDFDHERTGIVYRALDEFGITFQPGSYDARAHGQILVPASQVGPLLIRLGELARTGIHWREGGLGLR